MQEFKITYFERDNPGLAFPHFETVVPEKASQIRKRLAQRLRIDPDSDTVDLVNRIMSISQSERSAHADNQSFSLSSVMSVHRVNPEKEVFINWYRFDEIDRMSFLDLDLYFSEIWYPSSDDIDIFDESLQWILSVSHHGSVSFCRLG